MRIRLQGPGHATSLLLQLNLCRQSRRYCDVLLQVGNRTFAAHRAVLACAGEYFRNLFTRAPASSGAAFSLEFISPANFEKVLTFVYTGEIVTDLIDVGVLYELAERLGVGELVRACHATFPDLQMSASGKTGSPGGGALDSGVATAASICSSADSRWSPSSSAPAAIPSPPFQAGTSRPDVNTHVETLSLDLKAEDMQSHVGYGQLTDRHVLTASGLLSPGDGVLPPGATVQLKTEQGLENGVLAGDCADEPKDSCSLPDSSAPLDANESSSRGPAGGLQVAAVEGAVGGDVFGEETEEQREALIGSEEEHWRQLAGEIIELSDEENFLEEEDEDDLVCIGNSDGANTSKQVDLFSCKSCAAPLPADSTSVGRHSESHLTATGLCRLCDASFPDQSAGVPHDLAHVGVQLFTCDMCQLQFCSQNKLLRHHRQAASGYAAPQGASMSGSGQDPDPELRCAVCTKILSRDFQTVKEHVLSHVSAPGLTCSVCQRPQLSLCSLMWHALSHLALPVFCCPRCARCFAERRLLDRHLAAHVEEVSGTAEELHCFLCPLTFRSSSDFQYHLSVHTSNGPGGEAGSGGGSPVWPGKRKAERPLDCSPSFCSTSPQDGLLKMGSGLGFGPSPGVLANVQDVAGGVRGKWYRCRYCGKRFAHSGEFTYHLRIHTGEKPYQCKVCLRFFRGRSTMICHLKTHAGALMYRCTICGLYFSTLKLVSSHMELHKDQLPPDFNIEQTFMYNDHSKEPLPAVDP